MRYIRTHAHTHTHTHARTHARTHACTHARTHAHTECQKKELLLIIKLPCKKTSFQTSSEGRERGAPTENERERMLGLYSRETQSPTTKLLYFQGGEADISVNGRRAQRPSRDPDLDKVRQVLRGSASDNMIAETGCFVI